MKQDKWLITTQYYHFDSPLKLESGKEIFPVQLAYETYGQLNEEKSNGILILHAFSGDAHVAGYHKNDDRYAGWWNDMVGPGKAFDTNKYFIICSNVIGGCQGSTGPGSINPETGKPYGMSFPMITIGDMVTAQERLITHLGIDKLLAVTGGSMGGMQALQWSIQYPDRIKTAIVIASTTRLTAQGIAFHAVGRNAIMSDPHWDKGDYYTGEGPRQGLSIARMIGHITYLSDESMRIKFGRKFQNREDNGVEHNDQFAVESYLEYQGNKFVDRFDANTYIYISKALDYFDLEMVGGSLDKTFENSHCKYLIISYSTDWLFPTYQSKELVNALMKTHKEVSFIELDSPYGHDSFLLEIERQEKIIKSYLETNYAQ
ncbi:homoserine O-acetyltransferase MetX [Spirochaeta cellobiosiphila]|uniref:homoserine O-acetyltransferase MetX n=1 Tax=Spirochaeta cellobiosiphila TaxID=504483 RepID=UPI0003F81C38|nr:homoserine O-acetyltransferase [Spirochaeta cellobiosiphila]